jgi:hypothetical protein
VTLRALLVVALAAARIAGADEGDPKLDRPAPAPPPEPEGARVQLTATLAGRYYSGFGYRGYGGDPWLGARLFLDGAVRDDGTPRTLQPFLQRRSTLDLHLLGGGFDTRRDAGEPRRVYYYGAEVAVDAYLGAAFALTARTYYTHHRVNDTTSYAEESFSQSIGIGVRFGDVRFDASYRFAPALIDGAWRTKNYLDLGFFGVFAGHFRASGGIEIVEGGLFARVGLANYWGSSFGLYGWVRGGSGAIYLGDSTVVTRFDGAVGASLWPGRRFGVSLDVGPELVGLSGGRSQVTGEATLALYLRLP